jgi:hypothetical protein
MGQDLSGNATNRELAEVLPNDKGSVGSTHWARENEKNRGPSESL